MLEQHRIEPTISQKIGHRLVVEKKFADNNGNVSSYTTIGKEKSHCAIVIAVTKDNNIVVARQFRPGPEMVMDELPGGGVEENEDFETAARRELSEETGYTSDSDLIYLGDAHKDAYTNGVHHYFLLKDCYKDGSIHNDDGEITEAHEISISQLISNAQNAKMTDPGAVLQAYDILTSMDSKNDQ